MQRIKSLDLARGFTVLMMAPVHTILLYSNPAIYSTVLVKCLSFIAEGPGAQLFMLLMGIYISFQKQQSFVNTLKRSLLLLVAAYALNLFKFVIPLYCKILPVAMLSDLQVQNDLQGILHMFLLGDILHFASIALLIIYFVRRLKQFQYWSLLFAMIICFVAPFCWDKHAENYFIDYLLQLAGGQPPSIFFPLFPWLVYPLIGLSAGHFIKLYGTQVFAWLRNFGIAFILYGWLLKTFFIKQESISFYRTLPADTFKHIGIVLITLYAWQWLATHVTENYFFRLITYTGQHITLIYIIQWIVIIWLLPLFGYQQLNYNQSLFAIIDTSLVTLFLSVTINLIINKNSSVQ